MHLISVDLPAPLSPTSAITSPFRTSKSTSVSACTEPKLLLISRTASVGSTDVDASEVVAVAVMTGRMGGAPDDAPPRCFAYLQYFAYTPLQTSFRFRKPSVKRIL